MPDEFDWKQVYGEVTISGRMLAEYGVDPMVDGSAVVKYMTPTLDLDAEVETLEPGTVIVIHTGDDDA